MLQSIFTVEDPLFMHPLIGCLVAFYSQILSMLILGSAFLASEPCGGYISPSRSIEFVPYASMASIYFI